MVQCASVNKHRATALSWWSAPTEKITFRMFYSKGEHLGQKVELLLRVLPRHPRTHAAWNDVDA